MCSTLMNRLLQLSAGRTPRPGPEPALGPDPASRRGRSGGRGNIPGDTAQEGGIELESRTSHSHLADGHADRPRDGPGSEVDQIWMSARRSPQTAAYRRPGTEGAGWHGSTE